MESSSTASIYRFEGLKDFIREPTNGGKWDSGRYGSKEAFHAWLRLKPSAYSSRREETEFGVINCIVFEYGGGAIPLTRNESQIARRVGIEKFMHKDWLNYWVGYYLEKWVDTNRQK